MGSRSAYTVYLAKLLGIHYALEIALHRNGHLYKALEQIELQTNMLNSVGQQGSQQGSQQES
jgi:hypothetical protein